MMTRPFIAVAVVLLSVYAHGQALVSSAPFELYGDHVFIQLSVDDSEPVDFIFDTGDGLAVIDRDLADELGLAMDHKTSRTSAQGSISGVLILHNKVEINDVKVEDIELYATDLNHLERSIGRSIDGIIGYDLLRNYVVKLNYDEMMFEVYAQDGFVYTEEGEVFDFKLTNYIPTIDCKVQLNNGETYSEHFFVNTGAGTTVDFNTPFANKHEVVAKTGKHYSYPVAGLEDTETLHYEGRVERFAIGGVAFEDLPIGISQARHGIQHNKKAAGIIGSQVLRRFDITFDYSRGKIYMKPNRYLETPFSVNASGMNLQLNEALDQVLVHRVFESGPAEVAGIKQDAVLLEVNGRPAMNYTLPQLRALLKRANEEVALKVRQAGGVREVTLKLQELI